MKNIDLSGNKIIIVDDRIGIVKELFSGFVGMGAELEFYSGIEDSFGALRDGNYSLAVIDIHLPFPDSLPKEMGIIFEKYQERNEKGRLNLGQTLGMYINTLSNPKPFLYLSAVSDEYYEIKGAEPFSETNCFKKEDMSSFHDEVAKILKKIKKFN